MDIPEFCKTISSTNTCQPKTQRHYRSLATHLQSKATHLERTNRMFERKPIYMFYNMTEKGK